MQSPAFPQKCTIVESKTFIPYNGVNRDNGEEIILNIQRIQQIEK